MLAVLLPGMMKVNVELAKNAFFHTAGNFVVQV